MTSTATLDALDVDQLAARISQSRAEQSTRGCSNPIRLQGRSTHVDAATGEVVGTYSSDDEPDGHTYVRCGNRRASVCPSCSREYKGDSWHIIMAGLIGGLGVPDSVTAHPSVYVTLTAPSFGPVHRAAGKKGHTKKTPCRARRDRPVCPHGRPLSCPRRHTDDDRWIGQPLCRDCYDYTAHAVWQWHAPELWRRFTIALRRHLARLVEMTVKDFRDVARISYAKVAELQARGAIHFHAAIRLDGPAGPDTAPLVTISATKLAEAVRAAADQVAVDAPAPGGQTLRLRWGPELDVQTITEGAGRDATTGPAHPGKVGGYLAKYLTKSTEEFGLPATGRIRSASDARHAGSTNHVVRLIAAAAALTVVHEDYRPIMRHLGTLGYRGHVMTKSRAYSVTFGSRRDARRTWRRRRAHLEPDAVVRDVLDVDPTVDDQVDAVITLGSWVYAGRGYLTDFDAANAVRTHTLTRIRRAQ